MGWAASYITDLQLGKTVRFRPRGNSMKGKIESWQLCTIEPVDPQTVTEGDIVLCKVMGREYLHLVTRANYPRFEIGNNHGFINGWTTAKQIFGKCVRVEW